MEKYETMMYTQPIRIYRNKIQNRTKFKIVAAHYLEPIRLK